MGEYRFERKFLIEDLSYYEVKQLVKLHPFNFSELFQPRFINNIYFDTPGLDNYFGNLDGVKNRVKFRIRWYHDLFGKINDPVLELKFKKGLIGNKGQYPLPPFEFSRQFSWNKYKVLLKKSLISDDLKSLVLLQEPVLLNRYKRQYFISFNKKIRITLDTELRFFKVIPEGNNFIHSVPVQNVIMEIKYGGQADMKIGDVTGKFPFRMTKSSKYATGIEKMYNY